MNAPLASPAAVLFAQDAMQALATRPVFRAALCAGEPLVQLLLALRALPAFTRMDWNAVQLFALDDGWDAAALRQLHALPLPHANLHRPRSAGMAREQAARDYELTLRAQFGLSPGQLPLFDFILLGAGQPAALAGSANELARWVVARSHGRPGLVLSAVVIEAARRRVWVEAGSACEPGCAQQAHGFADSTATSSGSATPATERPRRRGFVSA